MSEVCYVPELICLARGRWREVVREEHGAASLWIESELGAGLLRRVRSRESGHLRAGRCEHLSDLALFRYLFGEDFDCRVLALVLPLQIVHAIPEDQERG